MAVMNQQELLEKFLGQTPLFLGPDPDIMKEHDIAPQTDEEARALQLTTDPRVISLVRSRLQSGVNEAFEMEEQMGAAPGAKWGDLICGIYSASGDLALSSTGGVLVFSTLTQHPVKFIRKYWMNEPTVGVRPGDVFMHNDARYGNIHNTDQSIIIPVFHEGVLIAWISAIVHEGENGAVEPGGMPSAAESPYMEGLKISPLKVGENYQLKRDLVTYFQNSVREPKLQLEDMKSKLFTTLRVKQRLEEAIADYGVNAVVATLRRTLEDTKEEVKRRLREWPDGTVRTVLFADSTLRENVLVKINLTLTKTGDRLVFDFRGSSPEFMNRANNTVLASLKGMLSQLFLSFVWPDLPRNQAVFAPIELVVEPRSTLNSSYETPNAQSMMTFFPAFSAGQAAVAKFLYSSERRYTELIAPWYNMITTFIYGGITQHGETVGNLCADLNGMGGGAHETHDGEHSIAPIFAAMADIGEQEFNEEENPFMQLVSKKLMRDNQAFGKFRGGQGYQMMMTTKGSPFWGFMTTCIGSKFPSITGLFGGYACPTYPLCKVKGVNVFEEFQIHPERFSFTIEDIMNDRPFPNATYSTHHMGLQFELAKDGELYMITQGSGGGYGDVLERDPQLVMKDLEEELISPWTASEIYHVVYDPDTLRVDEEATLQERLQERQRRLQRGVPYQEFVKTWVTNEPPADLPFFGSWNDRDVIYAGGYAGMPQTKMAADAITPVMMPDPKDVRIAELEQILAQIQHGMEPSHG
ncbi:MAG: acetone carboxylase subunit alpha [Sulfobacillus benefaciens]|uniref:Acetone carboxylase subunit alpha n=1 Tax=Sulfobacillus benefaciens TaxID=453960 RepID=A0A2T2XJ54_9FIRM|nr:MAG: acetone carboxylase subunit alpha [Sulfobacillus benefaciens]